jgi:hypothetical protein
MAAQKTRNLDGVHLPAKGGGTQFGAVVFGTAGASKRLISDDAARQLLLR